MKTNGNKISTIAAAIVVVLVATASISFACCGNCMGHGVNTSSSLTVEQQQKLDDVKEKYSSRLNSLQSSLENKANEQSKALANDNTTVGTLNRLEAEKAELESQYWALLDQANKEAEQYVSGNNGPWFCCNYRGCNHQKHTGPHSCGCNMGQSHQHGKHMNHRGCCCQ